MEGTDFLIEQRLRELDPELHKRFTESLFVLQKLLSDYLILFPEFTDHTEAHSLAIIDYCNNFLGPETVADMNADELYALLMACYAHDVGMGISEKDYHEFCTQVQFDDRLDGKDPTDADVIRAYHNDFSACFVRKYAQLFDFPSEAHEFAVIQIARGHRKADLFDEDEYPTELVLDNGNTIEVPFLAAILRLADEVNVARDRNSKLTFDATRYSTEKQRLENAKHEAIKKMTIYPDRIVLDVETDDLEVYALIAKLAIKLQRTLEYCRRVARERSDRAITQKKIVLNS